MPQLRVISIRPDLKGMLLGPGSIALSGGRKKDSPASSGEVSLFSPVLTKGWSPTKSSRARRWPLSSALRPAGELPSRPCHGLGPPV